MTWQHRYISGTGAVSVFTGAGESDPNKVFSLMLDSNLNHRIQLSHERIFLHANAADSVIRESISDSVLEMHSSPVSDPGKVKINYSSSILNSR